MIASCRICGGEQLTEVIDLGIQYLTGVFPSPNVAKRLTKGPLQLVRCTKDGGCGLVQLADSYDPAEMYGSNYGYRSGLNLSMVKHLSNRIRSISTLAKLQDGDVVIDIGSNDGTSLGFYSSKLIRIGIDPTASKFAAYYQQGAIPVSSFFSSKTALSASEGRKAAVVTAFSMMYDLENPVGFVREIAEVLDFNGLFVFEQSYLPLMLERVAFDTICHEHIEYYGLRQIDWILQVANMEVIDVELNDVNGGSFAVTAAHKGSRPISELVKLLRENEAVLWSGNTSDFEKFRVSTQNALEALKNFVNAEVQNGKTFGALGASTKGNVLLQAATIGPESVQVVGDVNPDKHGRVTPGTWIPIVSEEEALRKNFNYYIVLPWHFRDFFMSSPKFKGCTLVFPLPILEVVKL